MSKLLRKIFEFKNLWESRKRNIHFRPKIRKKKLELVILEISVQWPFEEIHVNYIYYEYHLQFAVLEDNTFGQKKTLNKRFVS